MDKFMRKASENRITVKRLMIIITKVEICRPSDTVNVWFKL